MVALLKFAKGVPSEQIGGFLYQLFYYIKHMSQCRRWCFTLNNYSNAEEETCKLIECAYLVIGREVGEEGTKHLQGYIEFDGGKRLATMKKLIPRAHFESCKGTAKQNITYCKKQGDVFEKGEPKQQGRRTDLEEIASLVEAKTSIREIAEQFPSSFIRYNRGIMEYKNLLQEHRDTPPCVVWLWGSTGVGKTRTATEDFISFYIKDGTQWWNGYEQQEAIVIDDFDGKWPFRDLLRLLDRYPYQGQTKGGYVKVNSPFIIITCSNPPEHIWRGDELEQIRRRINGNIYNLQ